MIKPCLWCEEDINTDEAVSTSLIIEPKGLVECRCGVRYSVEVIEQTEPEQWNRILNRDGFRVTRKDDELWVTKLW